MYAYRLVAPGWLILRPRSKRGLQRPLGGLSSEWSRHAIHACECTRMHMRAYACICMCMSTSTYTRRNRKLYISLSTYTYTYTYICIYIYIFLCLLKYWRIVGTFTPLASPAVISFQTHRICPKLHWSKLGPRSIDKHAWELLSSKSTVSKPCLTKYGVVHKQFCLTCCACELCMYIYQYILYMYIQAYILVHMYMYVYIYT